MARSNRSRRRRNSVSSVRPRSYSEFQRGRKDLPAVEEAKAPAEEATTARPLRSSESVNWTQEYGQVVSDLRNLLIVSAALFVAMVVLGYAI